MCVTLQLRIMQNKRIYVCVHQNFYIPVLALNHLPELVLTLPSSVYISIDTRLCSYFLDYLPSPCTPTWRCCSARAITAIHYVLSSGTFIILPAILGSATLKHALLIFMDSLVPRPFSLLTVQKNTIPPDCYRYTLLGLCLCMLSLITLLIFCLCFVEA